MGPEPTLLAMSVILPTCATTLDSLVRAEVMKERKSGGERPGLVAQVR